jgi:hypothetical protein
MQREIEMESERLIAEHEYGMHTSPEANCPACLERLLEIEYAQKGVR